MSEGKKDASYGAVIGALVGDACGSYLECCTNNITDEDITLSMQMPGGGGLRVGGGQITDDGELTVALLTAIVDSIRMPSKHLIVHISNRYIQWFESNPYNYGITKGRPMMECIKINGNELPDSFINLSKNVNKHSKSNSALMRCVPLGVYGGIMRLSDMELGQLVRMESMLTHSHDTCMDSSAVYCIAIAHLIQNPLDVTGAIQRAQSWAEKNACNEVKEFLKEALSYETVNAIMDTQVMNCKDNPGFVRYGFVMAFHFLKHKVCYLDAMKMTLRKEGDTDTNACIVGGLMGAYWGVNKLPLDMVDKVLQYSFKNNRQLGYVRPSWLRARNVTYLLETLMELESNVS